MSLTRLANVIIFQRAEMVRRAVNLFREEEKKKKSDD